MTDDGRNATLEGIDSTDFDSPSITAMSDTHAELLLTARLTFTAIIPKPAVALTENDTELGEQAATDTVQSTASIPVTCRLTFDSLAALTDAAHATIQVEQLNKGENIVFTP